MKTIIILTLALLVSIAGNFYQYRLVDQKIEQGLAIINPLQESLGSMIETNESLLQQVEVGRQYVAKLERSADDVNAASTEYIAALEAARDEWKYAYESRASRSVSASPARMVTTRPASIVRHSATVTPANFDKKNLAAVKKHAEQYYKSLGQNRLMIDLDVDCDDPRAVPGWPNRFEVSGKAVYSYYISVYGGSFKNASSDFTAQVVDGSVVDFTAR